jgi:hypothetical protein
MVKLTELISANLIEVNTALRFKRHSKIENAILLSDGTIKTSDGKIHKTPSGAARHLNGNKPIDGWLAWKIEGTKTSLADIRAKLQEK